MSNQKNLQVRQLRDKQFVDTGGCCQSSNGITITRPLKKLIKARSVKEVVLMHVRLCGIKALLGTNSYFWRGPSVIIETK
jgi:hypothetical protein